MEWLNDRCKKCIDKFGINEYNVEKISKYARLKYKENSYDEIEAEYMVKQKLGMWFYEDNSYGRNRKTNADL